MTDESNTSEPHTEAPAEAAAAVPAPTVAEPAVAPEQKPSKPAPKAKAEKAVELELTTNGRTVVFPQSIEADITAWFGALTLQPDLELPEGARFKE